MAKKIVLSTAMYFAVSFFFVYATSASAQKHMFYQISQSADRILPREDSSTFGSGTQSELNTSTYPDRVDSLLNHIYKVILEDHHDDTAFIRCFKNSQRAWLKFRDAELESIMPPAAPGEGGSIMPLCYWEYSVSITKRRIEELMMWYHGVNEEGDACGTSYWSTEELKDIRNKRKK